jgi:serine/threonine protein kinase
LSSDIVATVPLFVAALALTEPRIFRAWAVPAVQVRHPNIIKFQKTIETDQLICMIMENCDGGNLLSWINDGLLETNSAKKKVFAEILSAVLYLHENQIVHGDLKPDNIVMDSDGHPKLIDFGFSTTTGILTREAKYGTITYAAPELLEPGQYDAAPVDVWALGIVLLVMMTGRMPYRGETATEIKEETIAGEIVWPAAIDEDAKSLIRRCTAINPKDRPTVNQILSDPFLAEISRADCDHQLKSVERAFPNQPETHGIFCSYE